MLHRIRDSFKFYVERLILRGARYRLLLMVALIGVVSIIAGARVFRATPDFPSLREAIWWAFLRLTDPGYLGDDKGFVLALVSTVVTVLGYILFMGSLIAIMTQWLNETIRRLESGLTPVSTVLSQGFYDLCRFSPAEWTFNRLCFLVITLHGYAFMNFLRQVFFLDLVSPAKDKSMFNNIFQLSDIAGKVIPHQEGQGAV